MDNFSLAKMAERHAKADCFDGVGRIILSDFNNGLEEQVTAEQIIKAWKEYNPFYQIEQRTPNVILIIFSIQEREKRSPIINYE